MREMYVCNRCQLEVCMPDSDRERHGILGRIPGMIYCECNKLFAFPSVTRIIDEQSVYKIEIFERRTVSLSCISRKEISRHAQEVALIPLILAETNKENRNYSRQFKFKNFLKESFYYMIEEFKNLYGVLPDTWYVSHKVMDYMYKKQHREHDSRIFSPYYHNTLEREFLDKIVCLAEEVLLPDEEGGSYWTEISQSFIMPCIKPGIIVSEMEGTEDYIKEVYFLNQSLRALKFNVNKEELDYVDLIEEREKKKDCEIIDIGEEEIEEEWGKSKLLEIIEGGDKHWKQEN